MNNVCVSVIVPVYDSEEYIDKCIQSVLNQSYHDLELILIDDGSKDGSLEKCLQYKWKDDRVIVIHQENRGVSAARNRGLDCAKGDYISFLDSDDELTENAIELLISDALKYNADIVSGVKSSVLVNGDIQNTFADGGLQIYEGTAMLHLSLYGDRQTNSACAKLFKRSFIEDIFFVEGRNVNEDGFFLFCCYAKLPRCVQHNVCIYKYFVRKKSASRGQFSKKYLDMLFFCDEKRRIVDNYFPEMRKLMEWQEITTRIFFLEVLCRTSDPQYKSMEKESIQIIKTGYRNYESPNEHERRMAKIIRFGLYPVYKLFFRIKHRKTFES